MADSFTGKLRERTSRESSFSSEHGSGAASVIYTSSPPVNETPEFDFRTGVVQLQGFSTALSQVIGSL